MAKRSVVLRLLLLVLCAQIGLQFTTHCDVSRPPTTKTITTLTTVPANITVLEFRNSTSIDISSSWSSVRDSISITTVTDTLTQNPLPITCTTGHPCPEISNYPSGRTSTATSTHGDTTKHLVPTDTFTTTHTVTVISASRNTTNKLLRTQTTASILRSSEILQGNEHEHLGSMAMTTSSFPTLNVSGLFNQGLSQSTSSVFSSSNINSNTSMTITAFSTLPSSSLTSNTTFILTTTTLPLPVTSDSSIELPTSTSTSTIVVTAPTSITSLSSSSASDISTSASSLTFHNGSPHLTPPQFLLWLLTCLSIMTQPIKAASIFTTVSCSSFCPTDETCSTTTTTPVTTITRTAISKPQAITCIAPDCLTNAASNLRHPFRLVFLTNLFNFNLRAEAKAKSEPTTTTTITVLGANTTTTKTIETCSYNSTAIAPSTNFAKPTTPESSIFSTSITNASQNITPANSTFSKPPLPTNKSIFTSTPSPTPTPTPTPTNLTTRLAISSIACLVLLVGAFIVL